MSWFGHEAAALERALGLPRVVAEARVRSTMDAAHALAAGGTPAGTLVLAEMQESGRGRGGNQWLSLPRAGVWMTLVERPTDSAALEVLSLRVGLHLAPVLERWTAEPIQLKWPNDLFVRGAKLGGVLIEARWRDQRLDWVAVGVGINLTEPPVGVPAAALCAADAATVVAECVPALRAAAFARGPLSPEERAEFARRDLAAGRALTQPAVGIARGISPDGALLVESGGALTSVRAGSLVFST